MATKRVRAACAAGVHTLAPHLPSEEAFGSLQLQAANTLSPQLKQELYTLFDANMAPLAAGTSMQHSKAEKWEEMFDPDARYLVARGKVGELLGFASFRFDTEETLGPRDAEVAYCYELQLNPSVRGQGLGGRLMDELESIGRAQSMSKAMLTCLAGNSAALAFYKKIGYTPDEIDPTRIAEEEGLEDEEVRDYIILSKAL